MVNCIKVFAEINMAVDQNADRNTSPDHFHRNVPVNHRNTREVNQNTDRTTSPEFA